MENPKPRWMPRKTFTNPAARLRPKRCLSTLMPRGSARSTTRIWRWKRSRWSIWYVSATLPPARPWTNSLRTAALRSGSVAELVAPLNDSSLAPDRKSAIEQAIRNRISDLRELAQCSALPAEHPLRVAARALDTAFAAVTSGTVTDAQLALTEVSHRSPLAPWTFLIRAIAYFYRDEEEKCRQNLDAIPAESVPARLIPALRTLLGDTKPGGLTPAATALVTRFSGQPGGLKKALEQLDRAFLAVEEGEDEGRVFKAVRATMQEARKSAPEELEGIKRHIYVRGLMEDLSESRMNSALEGPPRKGAHYYRLLARGMEHSGSELNYPFASGLWDEFIQAAVREKWFAPDSPEVATVYLHMAEVLLKTPPKALKRAQQSLRAETRPVYDGPPGELYYLYPEKIFARACAIDPHSESFSKWMEWASQQSVPAAEKVAKEWSKARPNDIDPLLRLMEGAEKRNAFPSALGYLERAERADAVHPAVRAARLRLLAQSIITYLQKKKAHLAEEKLAAMAALPQSQQGDRPALVAALRATIAAERGDAAGAESAQAEAERFLGGEVPALLLFSAVNRAAKRFQKPLPPVKWMSNATRSALPQYIARIAALVHEFRLEGIPIPMEFINETKKQLRDAGSSLDTAHLLRLGELGLGSDDFELSYLSTRAGLLRGGPTEAQFLLQRALCLPKWLGDRQAICATAAAERGREHREMDVVARAVEFLRTPYEDAAMVLTPAQVTEVFRRETAAATYPTYGSPGPDYNDLFPDADDDESVDAGSIDGSSCQCPDCRVKRGLDPFGDDDDEEEIDDETKRKIFDERVPKGMPKAVADMLFDLMNEAHKNNIPFDEIVDRLPDVGRPKSGKKKKGRRK